MSARFVRINETVRNFRVSVLSGLPYIRGSTVNYQSSHYFTQFKAIVTEHL